MPRMVTSHHGVHEVEPHAGRAMVPVMATTAARTGKSEAKTPNRDSKWETRRNSTRIPAEHEPQKSSSGTEEASCPLHQVHAGGPCNRVPRRQARGERLLREIFSRVMKDRQADGIHPGL